MIRVTAWLAGVHVAGPNPKTRVGFCVEENTTVPEQQIYSAKT